jgi:hypothetical protein
MRIVNKKTEDLIGRRPTTKFQKQYAKKIQFGNREIWQFPGKYSSSPSDSKQVSIPKEIRVSKGIEPTVVQLNKIKGAWNVSNSPLGYSLIQDIVDLTGLDRNFVHQIII